MTVRTPEPAIDPQLGQLHGVGVCLAPGIEGGSPPPEDGNLLIRFTVLDNNRRAGYPFSGMSLFRSELHRVAPVDFFGHRSAADFERDGKSETKGYICRRLAEYPMQPIVPLPESWRQGLFPLPRPVGDLYRRDWCQH
jgi:hypothetical protein